jgi:uncharacterized membrane protein YgcG
MKATKYLLALFAFLTVGLLGAVAFAQEATILRVAGRAEILAQGRRITANEGYRIQPGQTISLVGGGEILMTTANGRINVKVLADTSVKYDGEVNENDLPWSGVRLGPREASTAPTGRVPQFSVPLGKLQIEVESGQEVRLVCPLILAAVRGTVFTVTVDLDGTSRVDNLEGLVATYGRHGEMRLLGAGQSAMVTARDYANFLNTHGVRPPRGDWRRVPSRTQERVDNDALGNIFGPGGGNLLAAVLANPEATPTGGVNAMAIEKNAIEEGSLFVDGEARGGEGDDRRITPVGEVLTPDSTLLNEGLPVIGSSSGSSSSSSGSGGGGSYGTGYVIGSFSLPTGGNNYNNRFIFDVDLTSGAISNALFEADFTWTSSLGYVKSGFAGEGGTGLFNLSLLSFSINGFQSTRFEENQNSSTAAYGTLGSGTALGGNLSSANYGGTSTGTLNLVYDLDASSPAITDLPTTYNLTGALRDKPFYDVIGTFTSPVFITPVNADYTFRLDANDGRIFDGKVDVNYLDAANDAINLILSRGAGTLSGAAFTISYPWGEISVNGVASQSGLTGAFSGALASATPTLGTQVSSGSLSVTYPLGASSFPTTLTVSGGAVNQAGL